MVVVAAPAFAVASRARRAVRYLRGWWRFLGSCSRLASDGDAIWMSGSGYGNIALRRAVTRETGQWYGRIEIYFVRGKVSDIAVGEIGWVESGAVSRGGDGLVVRGKVAGDDWVVCGVECVETSGDVGSDPGWRVGEDFDTEAGGAQLDGLSDLAERIVGFDVDGVFDWVLAGFGIPGAGVLRGLRACAVACLGFGFGPGAGVL